MKEKLHFSSNEIFKYLSFLAILVYIIVLMIFTSGSTKTFSEISKAVENVLDTDNLTEQNSQALKRYYGLNSADYDGVLFYSSPSSMSAEEVLLIKVKDSSQLETVQSAIEQRLKNRKNDFDGYAPDQVQLLDSSQLKTRGNFIFFAVAPDADKYCSTFTKSL